MQEPHVHQRLNKSALRCHIADYLQENKTMEKLGEEMEDSGILNNNERLKGANYARHHSFPPNGISKKRKDD